MSVDDLKNHHKDADIKKYTVIVNHIFEILLSICPAYDNAWKNQEEMNNTKKQWLIALLDSNHLNLKCINRGILKLRQRNLPYIPSPGQFIELCKPTAEDLSLPSAQKAFEEACRNCHPLSEKKWTHETIYAAAMATGSYELSRLPSAKVFPLFERNYEIAMRNYVNGERVDIPKALTEVVQNKSNPAIAKLHLDKIRNILGKGAK